MNATTPQIYDYMAKFLLLGDSKVGKTAIMQRFSDDVFPKEYITTIGIDYKHKTIPCENEKWKIQFWDTSGQEKYRTIISTYYKGAIGIILVYAVDNRSSFQSVERWLKMIKEKAQSGTKVALVGNKSDIEQREVTYEEGKEMADKNDLIFFETSAKEGAYIEETFYQLTTAVKKGLADAKG